MRIIFAIEDAGEDLVAIFHSHTRSPAVPSATDRRTAHVPGPVLPARHASRTRCAPRSGPCAPGGSTAGRRSRCRWRSGDLGCPRGRLRVMTEISRRRALRRCGLSRPAAARAAEAGRAASMRCSITPSPDYDVPARLSAPALERLTCLVLPADGAPTLVLPRLEEPLARHALGAWPTASRSSRGTRPRTRSGWSRRLLGGAALRVGDPGPDVGALRAAAARRAGPGRAGARRVRAMSALRRDQGARGDRPPASRGRARPTRRCCAITAERLSGRTEAEVSRRIDELLLAAGHETAEFAIVGLGAELGQPAPRGRGARDRVPATRSCSTSAGPGRLLLRHDPHRVRW